jgi:hypothetical protein
MSEQLSRQELLEQKRSCWKQHIEGWRSSGMTQTAYCQQHELSGHQFTYWKKRFVQTETGIRFVPIKIRRSLPLPGAMESSPLRVTVNGDLQIEIGHDFDPQLLRRLIATLRSLP